MACLGRGGGVVTRYGQGFRWEGGVLERNEKTNLNLARCTGLYIDVIPKYTLGGNQYLFEAIKSN